MQPDGRTVESVSLSICCCFSCNTSYSTETGQLNDRYHPCLTAATRVSQHVGNMIYACCFRDYHTLAACSAAGQCSILYGIHPNNLNDVQKSLSTINTRSVVQSAQAWLKLQQTGFACLPATVCCSCHWQHCQSIWQMHHRWHQMPNVPLSVAGRVHGTNGH